ncbi:hypothetical protein [Lentibacillus saliphilus]|uniref:hypothetical protein n=1 Tax=Lentibacillus saliphilus TaxID=2737028 RepID=UPI001C30DDC1|nr:hypothetical protein [Lentibacillus saliphilus]
MTSYDDKDKKIIDMLKSLPSIDDEQSKDELYQRVIQNIESPRNIKRKKHVMLFPILATAAAFLIGLILLPGLFNEEANEANHFEKANDIQHDDEGKSADDQSNKEIHDAESDTFDTDQAAIDEHDQEERAEKVTEGDTFSSYVLKQSSESQPLVYGALPDQYAQYVIPMTFVYANAEIATDNALTSFYNELEKVLTPNEWGMGAFPIKDITFQIDMKENRVIAEVADDFSIGDGSARAYMFEKTLNMMFRPLGIQQVDFKTVSGKETIELGPFGEIDEMPIEEKGKAIYKMYYPDKATRSFLLPVPQDETIDITTGISLMKENELANDVFASIPEDVNLTASVDENVLILSVVTPEKLENDRDTQVMIEAMLMTAKDFGFTHVVVKNSGLESIGPYDVTEKIAVPKAINPIEIAQ